MEDEMMMEDGGRVDVNLYGNVSQKTKRWIVTPEVTKKQASVARAE
jgi:hypothetical protein